jgi:hypothetical protein
VSNFTPAEVGTSSEISKFVTARIKVLVEAMMRDNTE